jgi:type II secretory pathway pseudopilin PulG
VPIRTASRNHLTKNGRKRNTGISSVITTLIITGVLLILLVVASFAAINILGSQIADTEFEQAKSNMSLLDEVIQDVALRRGAGGYVQFNQRTGGIGINQTTNSISLIAVDNVTGERTTLGNWSSLLTLLYHGGSQVSGAEINITGTPKLNVGMSEPPSFLRVEVGPGLWVKLDYNRVRTIPMGKTIVNNTAYDLYDITFIRLKKGNITGASDTVNFKVQNLDIITNSTVYDNRVTIYTQLNNGQTANCVVSNSTVIMITEIPILVSIG